MQGLDMSLRLRLGGVGLILAALAACSTPLPPAGAPGVASPPPPPIAPAASAPEAAASAPAAEPYPVSPGGPGQVEELPPPLPFGAAVAARFPDPDVLYTTPGFAPGRSAFTSNEELLAFLNALADSAAQRLGGTRVIPIDLGTSQNGVPLEALLFTRGVAQATVTPEAVLQNGRSTVLLVGQQHGNEPAGSEALLVVAQQLAGGVLEPLLDRINVVILPRANPDGAAANQRATQSGVDMNRDHLLLRTPEAQAVARLVREFQPAVIVDAHEYPVGDRYLEKFGAVQSYDAMLQYAMTGNMREFVSRASEEWFHQPLVASLKAAGLSSQWYYTTSPDMSDHKVAMGGSQPDTLRNVGGLRNSVSLLLETRGGGLGRLHFKRRVYTQVTAISSVLRSAGVRSGDLVKLRQYADQEVKSAACHGEAVVETRQTPSEFALRMLDPLTGADKRVTVTWDSALALASVKVRPRPCGYWLADSESNAAQHLRALGVRVMRIDEQSEMRGETYRETARESVPRADGSGPVADGGSSALKLSVQTEPTLIDVRAGGYYVPLDQRLANLVIAALEPDTSSSFAANRIIGSIDGEARVLQMPEMRMSELLP
jgi:hypothetical protein